MVFEQQQVTQLLLDWRDGNRAALDGLLPLVHDELHRIAHRHMRRERPNHTLQTSALLNEAYLRLVDQEVAWQNRAHFFAIAANLMRQILINYAEARNSAKRGGGQQQVSLTDAAQQIGGRADDVLALNQALEQLATLNPKQARVVELRFFGGLTIEETAQVLGVSHGTVERDWKLARAFLHHTLR